MPKQNKNSNFIEKLASMIQEHPEAIAWSKSGKFFSLINEELLQSIVFPEYFRHSKLSSFIRQLSAYNFKKIKTEQGEGYHHPIFFLGNALNYHQIYKRSAQDSQQIPLLGTKTCRDTSVQNLMRKLVTFEFFCHRKTQNIKNLIANLKDQVSYSKKQTMEKFKAIQRSINSVSAFSDKVHDQYDKFIKDIDQDIGKSSGNPDDSEFFGDKSDSFALPHMFIKHSISSPGIQNNNGFASD